ncbi:unnamed protein product [Lampetra fluviatilis]
MPQVGDASRLLSLASRSEWPAVENLLSAVERPDASLFIPEQESGLTLLMMAVRDNRLAVVERLLELGANLGDRAHDGRTALHVAAAQSRDEMVKCLLLKKADPNLTGGPSEQLPLHMAASRPSGAIAIVQMLLKSMGRDARLAHDEEGRLPLLLAVEVGNLAVCRELLALAPDVQVTACWKGSGDTALHVACKRRDHEVARLLVEAGAQTDVQNDEGFTPLHISAWEGDEAMLKLFYNITSADPNITDKLDRSPLHIAAERGHTSVVEVLTDKFKSDVMARTKDGSTLMHIASQCGHPDTALAFLKKGVPLQMPNKAGALCLHVAARRGHAAVVRALLQKGAPPDARAKDGHTALHAATLHCRPLAVQALLGFGAQVQLTGGPAQETPLHIAARVPEGEKVAEMLLKSGANVNAVQKDGQTALHVSARHGHLKMLQALLEEGGDLTCLSEAGEGVLHVAVRHGHVSLVREILRVFSADPRRFQATALVNQANEEGETPLHFAVELPGPAGGGEVAEVTRLLLQHGADPAAHTYLTGETPTHYSARAGGVAALTEILNHVGPNGAQRALNRQAKNGWTPLMVAVEEGRLEVVNLLLENHARVDVFDEHGKAALHLAAESGRAGVAGELLRRGAFANAKSKLGHTPLHAAAGAGHAALVLLLARTHGAAVDALTLRRRTPLHLAATGGQLDVCRTLLQLTADVNAADDGGQTALHLAADSGHPSVVALFVERHPALVAVADGRGRTCAHIAAARGSAPVLRQLLRHHRPGVTAVRSQASGSTPLQLAAAGGHAEAVRILLEAGASPAAEDSEGMAAIHLAAKHGHTGVLEALKQRFPFNVTSTKTGFTALHVAARFGQVDFAREMLASVPAAAESARPNPVNVAAGRDAAQESGLTPLHLAAQAGHEGLVRLLLNHPSTPEDLQVGPQATTPLHLACQGGHAAVAGLLLSRAALPLLRTPDQRGHSCLHLAATAGHVETLRLLLGQGADINATDKSGCTPLHVAARAGRLPAVRALLESGAAGSAECRDGRTALEHAAGGGHRHVLAFLLRHSTPATQRLIHNRRFVYDLVVCGQQCEFRVIDDFVLLAPAPLEAAVKLTRALGAAALREKERSVDLELAARHCQALATDLLSLAVGSQSAGAAHLLRAVDERGLSLLDVLIECHQREVAAHPAVQHHLSDVWRGGLRWPSWCLALLLLGFLVCPPLWVAFSLPLGHRFTRIPIIKFLCHLASHLFLLSLFVLTVVWPPVTPIAEGHLLPSWNEWLLLTWLLGLLLAELRQGGSRFGLAWIRLLVLGLSGLALLCHLSALAFPAGSHALLECLCARNVLLAKALAFCCVQLLDFLSFHHLFGPWAIIISDLMKDLARFGMVLGIFHVAFTLHLTALCQPVYPQGDPVGNSSAAAAAAWDATTAAQTTLDVTVLLFFSLFGMGDQNSLPDVSRSPSIVSTLVNATFGVYLIVTLIVLINLLIAMMSDTYQRIQAQSDTQWKFGRAVLVREATRRTSPPAPLNVVTQLLQQLQRCACRKGAVDLPSESLADGGEEVDRLSNSHSIDIPVHSTASWLHCFARRRPKVSPAESQRVGERVRPCRIEDVLDWRAVAQRYRAMKGTLEESQHRNVEDSLLPTAAPLL